MFRSCDYCRKMFEPKYKNQKFCNEECEHQEKLKKKFRDKYKKKYVSKLANEKRICSFCKEKFTPIGWNQHVCNDCRDETWRNLNLGKPLIREYFLEKFNWTCQECGKNGLKENEFHCHHIKPMCKGGEDKEKNITLMCIDCHKKIHNLSDF